MAERPLQLKVEAIPTSNNNSNDEGKDGFTINMPTKKYSTIVLGGVIPSNFITRYMNTKSHNSAKTT